MCRRYEGVTVTSDREPVILMRLYQGGSLARLVQGGKPLPVEQALRCARSPLPQSRAVGSSSWQLRFCCVAGQVLLQCEGCRSALQALALSCIVA